MALTIVGGKAKLDVVLPICDKYLKESPEKRVESTFPKEPDEIAKEYVEQKFPVSIPLFQLVFKESVSKERLTDK